MSVVFKHLFLLRVTVVDYYSALNILMLRIRIRDPVPFGPLDPRSGMGKKIRIFIRDNIPDHISESLETFMMRNRIRDLFDPGSGKHIPDPQQRNI